jgi:Transglycosylase SLT domain
MEQVSTTQCRVSLYAPNGTPFAFEPVEVGMGLLGVETSKDLNQAVGSFTLTFDGREGEDRRRWDERIPRRALAFIHMERQGSDQSEADTTVMIGLTDLHSVQETYTQAAPRRRVTIAGRELSCVILDAMLYYDPYLAINEGAGTLTLQTKEFGPVRLSLIANPALVVGGLDPAFILRKILDTFLFVGGESPATLQAAGPEGMPLPQQPLIALNLPGMRLARLLDANYDGWSTFVPGVKVPISHFPVSVGSLWNYLHLYIDRNFQEFFTRVEDGQCRIHFRGKPFKHEYVTSGTRFQEAAETKDTLQTLTLDPADIVSLQLARDTAQVYNIFKVLPRGFSNSHGQVNWRYRIQPQVVADEDHPSFVGRYGVRLLEVQSMYLSPYDAEPGPAAQVPPPPRPLKPSPAAAKDYAGLANQIAAQQGIPAELRPWFVASIERESSWNPNADGTSGEKGLGQLMPGTIAQVGGITNPYDPVQSLTGAAKYWNYLRGLPNIGNNPQLILAGYNAGPGSVVGGKVPRAAEPHVRAVTALVPRYQSVAGVPPAPVPAPAPVAAQADSATLPMIETAEQWAAILRAWYDMGGELLSGTVVVRGHPRWNVGHRLLCSADPRGPWEAYIEGVRHTYDVRTGQYLTILRLTRGWSLSPAWTLQLVQEGQTTIEGAVGGPPTLDPETGEPVPAAGTGDVEVIVHE